MNWLLETIEGRLLIVVAVTLLLTAVSYQVGKLTTDEDDVWPVRWMMGMFIVCGVALLLWMAGLIGMHVFQWVIHS